MARWTRKAANGARGRNRTGTELPPRDFLTTTTFAADVIHRLWSGLSLHLMKVRGSRQVSTLSTRLTKRDA